MKYYADKTRNRLQDLAGNPVSAPKHYFDNYWEGQRANLKNVTVLPWPQWAMVDGKRLTLIFDGPMNGGSTPAASAFTVKVNGSAVSLASTNPVTVNPSGRKVILTLASAVAAGDTVTVSYERPASGRRLQNVVCENSESFADLSVTNGTGVAPTGVAVTSDPGDDDTYGLGDTIRVTLTFSEAVDVTGIPRLMIKMGPDSRNKLMWYESGSGTTELTFARRVSEQPRLAQADISTAGIAVLADSVELNGGAIRYASSGEPAYLAHSGLDHDPNHKVDWRRPPVGAPWVTDVALSSSPGFGFTYGRDETIRVTVTFSEAVTVTGEPRLLIDLVWGGPHASDGYKSANYESGSGTAELTFAYTVAAADRSEHGIAVVQHRLDLNGGAILSAATQVRAHLWYQGLGHDLDHRVHGGVVSGTPIVNSAAVTSDPGDDDTYGGGDVIHVTLTFSEAVDVDATGGAPRLRIKMDPTYGEQWASYESGSGTASLTFAYTVAEVNRSPQGIAVLGGLWMDLNGGVIRSAATQTNAHLWYAGLGHDPEHKVDGSL